MNRAQSRKTVLRTVTNSMATKIRRQICVILNFLRSLFDLFGEDGEKLSKAMGFGSVLAISVDLLK